MNKIYLISQQRGIPKKREKKTVYI